MQASPGCQLLQMGVERRKGGNNGGQDRHIDPKETGICVSQLPIQDVALDAGAPDQEFCTKAHHSRMP